MSLTIRTNRGVRPPHPARALGLRLTSALTAFALVTTLAIPRAQAVDTPLPPSQPPPASAQAPNGEYVAPLQQQTQQIYVPQSVAVSGPRVINDYDESEPVPPGYHAETRVRKGPVIAGAVVFGVFYLFSLIAGAAITDANRALSNDKESGELLYIPVAGPFLQMTNTKSSSGNLLLAIDGVAQGTGAALFIWGITSPRTVLVRNDLAEVRVAPMRMGQNGGGLGLVGTF